MNDLSVSATPDNGAAVSASDDDACVKRSFLRLPIAIDRKRLIDEYESIPADAWGVSHWDVHCSIDVLLLRGGANGKPDDFTTDDVVNNPLVERLPYIGSLLAPEGPFGGAVYAFIFRTKPNGMTRVHTDDNDAWKRTIRIHMPIVTNDGAVLLSEGRSKHLEVGEAWTFDNQTLHSVMNGDATRVHMIIDVRPNPKISKLMRDAVYDPGEDDPERWAETGGWDGPPQPQSVVFAFGEPLLPEEKSALNLPADGFATRVTRMLKNPATRIMAPLKLGDIVVAVDGVASSNVSRSALDHLFQTFKPWSATTLDILRDGSPMQIEVRTLPRALKALKTGVKSVLRPFGYGAREKSAGY